MRTLCPIRQATRSDVSLGVWLTFAFDSLWFLALGFLVVHLQVLVYQVPAGKGLGLFPSPGSFLLPAQV